MLGAIRSKQQQNWNISQSYCIRSQPSKFSRKILGYWILWDCNKKDPELLPKGDKRAVDILAKTTKKEENRYSVSLLWKEDTVTLPNNRLMAISKMISLEKKFDRQPDL